MIDTQALRKKILDAAIRGKLTKQLLEDGNAEDLYKEIQAEKQRLIKEGKLKKEKALPAIGDKEIPFDIPENWKWVRLGLVCSVFGGKRVPLGHRLVTNNTGHIYIRVSDMQKGTILDSDIHYITEDVFRLIRRYTISKDDIYITVAGTIGRVGLVPERFDNANLTENADKICVYLNEKRYLYYLLSSDDFQHRFVEITTAVGQPKLAISRIQNIYIPLPPVTEQKRIVSKIATLFAKLDLVDHNQERLSDNSIALRSKLIELGIKGELTEQLAEDGNAEDLYKEIQAEKQRLIKEGKLKKEKSLPEIEAKEIPFDIPENWKWMRLGECGSWGAGATPARNDSRNYLNGTIPWLKTGDLNDSVINNVPEFITEYAFNTSSVRLNPVGSVLIAMYGATIGKLGILGIEATTNQACCACIPFSGVYNWFLYYVLLAYRGRFIEKGAGGAQPNISKEKIIMTEFPLPPLAEQKRIVEKLEQLLPLCDSMSKDIAEGDAV